MSSNAGQQNSIRRRSMVSNNQIFRRYYTENDLLSPEGILKLISICACVVSAVLFLTGGPCVGAPALVASSATSALAVAGAEALLAGGRALAVPLLAPQPYLYLEIVVSTVAGVLLLVTGVLSFTLCHLAAATDYLHGPLAIATSAMLVTSAVLTYRAAMRLWDAAAGPAVEPRPPPSSELEV